jgi:hypothetical protein
MAAPGRRMRAILGLAAITLLLLLATSVSPGVKTLTPGVKTLTFSGYDWTVKSGSGKGPGPNDWDDNNVSVDRHGYLHLKLTQRGGCWYCSQVSLSKRLGFGEYQFWIIGRVDSLDPNVVFGLFNYPTADVGPDGTNEIDVEFAKWGRAAAPIGNYTVWPAQKGPDRSFKRFALDLHGDYTTHRFAWTATGVSFKSLAGHRDDSANELAQWVFQPPDPARQVGHNPEPVQINLWLFKGQPPLDGKEVELIISAFKFTPAP